VGAARCPPFFYWPACAMHFVSPLKRLSEVDTIIPTFPVGKRRFKCLIALVMPHN
jgi:hypothetical protein